MSEAVAATTFLSLPPEICIQILLELGWNELLVNQRVCKKVKALIQSSQVDYRITLGMAGYDDGPDSHPMPTLERNGSLKALQNNFTRLEFPTETAIELQGFTPTYELQGGVFLQGRPVPTSLEETIGVNGWSFHGRGEPHAWRLTDFRQPIRDLTLDPSQDLLVLIEGGRPGHPLSLHFLSLTTGKIHPLVTGSLKCPDFTTSLRYTGFIVTIAGELVGLLQADVCFFVCNWKTGKLHVSLDFRNARLVDDFFFLDHDRLVLIRTDKNPGGLEVYKLSSDEDQQLEPAFIAVYHLPKLAWGVVLVPVHARLDPPPQSNPTTYKSSPIFATSPYSVRMEDRIIILTLEMQTISEERTLNLVVRAETLMKIPINAQRVDGLAVVTSEMWMRQTRLLPDVVPPFQWMCYVYGSRMIIPVEGPVDNSIRSGPMRRVQPTLLDFNPSLVAWADSGKRGTPWNTTHDQMRKGSDADTLLEVGKKSAFLAEDWVSGLPFVVVTSLQFEVPESEGMVVMIDDRRLLALQMVPTAGFGRGPHWMRIYE